MKNASDNANEIAEDLDFTYNHLRQASITAQILEIAGAAEAFAKE